MTILDAFVAYVDAAGELTRWETMAACGLASWESEIKAARQAKEQALAALKGALDLEAANKGGRDVRPD